MKVMKSEGSSKYKLPLFKVTLPPAEESTAMESGCANDVVSLYATWEAVSLATALAWLRCVLA